MKKLLILISVLVIAVPTFGQSGKYETVESCALQVMEDRGLTGNRMFAVDHKECEKKINVTKTDIIEHKGELVRKYLEKREIGSVDQNNDRGYMTLPFTDILPPEFWNLH